MPVLSYLQLREDYSYDVWEDVEVDDVYDLCEWEAEETLAVNLSCEHKLFGHGLSTEQWNSYFPYLRGEVIVFRLDHRPLTLAEVQWMIGRFIRTVGIRKKLFD